MKKYLVLLVCIFMTQTLSAQEQEDKGKFFKSLYEDLLKYSTIYGAGDISNSVEARQQTYFVRTNPDGGLYSIPDVVDNTPDYPFDYRYGFGIRKLARFNYERKPKNFYDGTEEQLAFTAPSSALEGLEYQFHFEKERWRGENFKNHRFFLKHTGKYHIVKVESREVGKINLDYQSAEVRGRLPIGEKFSISAGAIYRTHDRAYGYNPIEIWLNETQIINGEEYPANYWYTLGFEYGYDDIYYTQTSVDPNTGEQIQTSDWYWVDSEGNIVADSDLEFRETVFTDLMNRYNNEVWDQLDAFGEIAPIVGVDFYHYKSKFWLHAYANYILPYHRYIEGDEAVSYLNRNNWGKGGLVQDAELEQWEDYSAGVSFGWKINKNLGIFAEGEYSKMWDSELFQTTFGLNFTFR
tara:strand:- start:2149 stop:3372 length:1224 start_codon:yes stop_codon:yes gene_type:complete